MNHLTKQFARTILLTSILSGCNFGSNSAKNDIVTPTPTPTPAPTPTPTPATSVDVSGTAVKGIIKNGVVKIYGITAGVTDTTALVEGVTDANGDYSLSVEGYTGPVVIEITAGASSTMVCDIIAGCDGTAFGADIALTSDFNLKAVVPSIEDGEDITTNVTALTSLAASLAEAGGTLDASAVEDANSQVAALFNIVGDITQIEVIDITDTVAVNAANAAAVEASLLNAALLTAALADTTDGTSVGAALAAVASDFATNTGQLVNNETTDSATVTLAEILEEVVALATSSSFSEADLGTLVSTTELLLTRAESAPADSITTVVAPEPADDDPTQAAKDMVEIVRSFGLSATYDSSEETTFLDKMDMSMELVSEDDIDTIFDSLEMLSEALSAAADANMSAVDDGDDALTTFMHYDDTQFAIPVTITESTTADDTYTYSIDMTIPDTVTGTVELDADVSAELLLTFDEVVNETATDISIVEDETYSGELALSLAGMVSSTNVLMTINSGDLMFTNFDSKYDSEETETSFEDTDVMSLDLAALNLNITLEQLTGNSPVSFTGALGIEFSDVSNTEEYSNVDQASTNCDIADGPDNTDFCWGRLTTEETSFTTDKFDISLSGLFVEDDESVKATIALSIDPDTSVHEQTYMLVDTWQGFWEGEQYLDGISTFDETDEVTGETEENPIDINLGIALDFELAGTSQTTGVVLTAARNGLEQADISLDLRIGSDRLTLVTETTDSDDLSMSISDQYGNTLMLSETCAAETDDCTTTGSIYVEGEQAASVIEDDDSDALIITYTDGSFELL